MGNCCGKSADSKRRDNWRATGIVSLRDSGLKTLPGAVLEISNDIRILDASNNRWARHPTALNAASSIAARTRHAAVFPGSACAMCLFTPSRCTLTHPCWVVQMQLGLASKCCGSSVSVAVSLLTCKHMSEAATR